MKKLTLDQKYDSVRNKVAELINEIDVLYQEEKSKGGQIAQWGLTYAHEDLIKIYHRLGNLKFTIRKKK